MDRYNHPPNLASYPAEYNARPTPISRPFSYPPAHPPPQSAPPPRDPTTFVGAPIMLSPSVPAVPQTSYDLFNGIDWSWAQMTSPSPPTQFATSPVQQDLPYLQTTSPEQHVPPMYASSDSPYTPLTLSGNIPFPPTSGPIPLDANPHHAYLSKPYLSTSLPANVSQYTYEQSPTSSFSLSSDSSVGHQSVSPPEWPVDPTQRVIRRRPMRKSESDTSNLTLSRVHPRSPLSRNSFLPSSPISRTPPASIPFSNQYAPSSTSSPGTVSPFSSPGLTQVRSIGTDASAAGATPDPTSGYESDEGAKKKRKRDPKDQAPKKSLLQPPKASPSTWQIYFTDHLQMYRSRHPDQKLNVAQAAKELAQEYKTLTAEQREPYKRRAQAAKLDRDRQMAAWERTLTPGDVRAENQFRAAQRKDGKSRKANMKDPNAPKKPLSAYFMFLQWIRSSDEMVREVFGDEQGTTKQSVLAAAKWRSMSDDEKKPFLARAEQEKLQYEAARREYEESFADGGEGSPDFALGHFVGIEQLSLGDKFVAGTASPKTKVPRNDTERGSSSQRMTQEDYREAFEESAREQLRRS